MTQRLKKLLDNRIAVQVLIYSVLFLVALFVVYWMRVFYYFDYASGPTMVLIATITLFAIYTIMRLVVVRVKDNFALWGAVLVLLCGLLFAFANPPLQTPDENAHFLRTYAISCGYFDFDPTRVYPNDVALMLEEFEPFYSHYHTQQGDQIIYRYEDYFNRLAANDIATTDKNEEPILMLILPYLPSAAVIAPLRALGVSALVLQFVARIVNVVIFAAICYYALSITKRFRVMFLATMLFPTTLFIGASTSYDSAMLAMSILLLAFAFKEKITTRDVIIICIVTGYISHIKILNVLLLLPLLIINKNSWVTKIPKWLFAVLLSLSAIIGSLAVTTYAGIFSSFEPIPRLDSVDPVGQILFILGSIPRYLIVMFGSFYENTFFISDLSNFGWTDTEIPIIAHLVIPLMILVALLFAEFRKGDMPMLLMLLFFAAIYTASAITGLYVTNTPVAMVRAVGVQARYFLPAVYAFFIALSMFFGRHISVKSNLTESAAVAVLGGFSSASALLLFLTHNVMW